MWLFKTPDIKTQICSLKFIFNLTKTKAVHRFIGILGIIWLLFVDYQYIVLIRLHGAWK